jgi:BRCT domain type II-containing protein
MKKPTQPTAKKPASATATSKKGDAKLTGTESGDYKLKKKSMDGISVACSDNYKLAESDDYKL